MAGGMDLGTSARGGRRPLDATINLVPFIDLMAVTISFLLLTSVWVQAGRLEVSQRGPSAGPAPQEPTAPPLVLVLTAQKVELSIAGVAHSIPLPAGGVKAGLEALRGRLLDARRASGDAAPPVQLRVEDSVRYEDLVRVVDECVGAGYPSVSVEATG